MLQWHFKSWSATGEKLIKPKSMVCGLDLLGAAMCTGDLEIKI